MRVFCSCIRAQTYVALLFVCLWTLGHFWALGRKRLTTLIIGTLTLSSLDPQKKSLLVCSLLTLSFGKHICCWIDCIFIYRSTDIFGSIINDSFRAQTLTRIPTKPTRPFLPLCSAVVFPLCPVFTGFRLCRALVPCGWPRPYGHCIACGRRGSFEERKCKHRSYL